MSACSVDAALPSRIDQNFSVWKDTTKLALTNLIASANTKNGQLSDGEKAQFETLQRDIFNTLACLQEKMTQEGSTTNQIHEAQTQILELQEQLKEREEEIKMSLYYYANGINKRSKVTVPLYPSLSTMCLSTYIGMSLIVSFL